MEPSPLLDVAERFLVWIVAVLAGLGAIREATQGLLDGRIDRVFLWFTVAIAMVAATLLLERIKARQGG